MRIGLCGTGKMGSAMAERLMDEGESLMAWNRTPDRADPLIARGAQWAESPAALAAASDLVIVMLIDDAALGAVYEGDAGLLSRDLAGTLIVEMSTVRPDTSAAYAERVGAAGGRFLECPVGGTVAPARGGKLLGMAGGEAHDFERARPVLDKLCRRLEHVGGVGAGAAMKLAINLPLIVYWEALGEALSLCEHAGVDAALAGDILCDSSGAIAPAGARVPAILDVMAGAARPAPNFALSASAKDLRLAAEVAASAGFELPVARAAHHCYEDAIADGWGDTDFPMQAAWRVAKRHAD